MEQVKLSLTNVCDGLLEQKFQEEYPKILHDLKQGKKATITMKIDVQRMDDSETLLTMASSFDVKMPASPKKQKIYSLNANDFTVQTEKPKDPDELQTVLKFDKKA